MNYWILAGAVITLLLVAALVPKKTVHAEAVINASPAAVWAMITDTNGYDDWNPIFQSLQGSFKPGETVAFNMRLQDGSFTAVEAQVKAVEPERLLHQRAGMIGVITADHQWRLEPADGATRVVQHEEYRGIYVWFYDPGYVQVLYAEGLAAIKTKLEQNKYE